MNLHTRIPILLFSALIALQVAVAQQTKDTAERETREAVCQRVTCRPPTTVRLRLNDKEYFEMQFPKGPYVADGFINILAGEELNVEFDDRRGQLSNPHYVKSPVHPERTISLRLEQKDENMILEIKNPFPKEIVYDCLIQHYSEQRLRRTSVLPVGGGLMSFESWPYPVAQVVISHVRYSSQK